MDIYIVEKNEDFQEGRGSMLFHKAYLDKAKALSFILGHFRFKTVFKAKIYD